MRHHISNIHMYENQVDTFESIQRIRKPYYSPVLMINPNINTLVDLETWAGVDDFKLINYQHHPVIKHPFTV